MSLGRLDGGYLGEDKMIQKFSDYRILSYATITGGHVGECPVVSWFTYFGELIEETGAKFGLVEKV